MQPRLKLLGHAVHPMLIVFPLGLLGTVPLFDVLAFATNNPVFGPVAFWVLTIGLLGGVAAAITGFVDWRTIPPGTRASRVGLVHMFTTVAALGLFSLSWWARLYARLPDRHWAPFVLALAALVVVLVGGWLGGELVQQYGVGVRDGAGLDAPSSFAVERDERIERQHVPSSRPRTPEPIG